MDYKSQLLKLYREVSKHSNYQILPTALKEIIGENEIEVKSRYEKERLDYITSKVDFNGKSVLDIGGNTGYFTFELLGLGAKHVCHYEGNKQHSEFVDLSAKALGVSENIKTINDYYNFEGTGEKYDIALIFNVIHHLGDDYDAEKDIESAKKKMIVQLNNMAKVTNTAIFQMGFNWQGDVSKPLFKNGTKKEMIDFIKSGIEGFWDINSIGIAEKYDDDKVEYKPLTEKNIARNDTLGEFLNRPIFILKK